MEGTNVFDVLLNGDAVGDGLEADPGRLYLEYEEGAGVGGENFVGAGAAHHGEATWGEGGGDGIWWERGGLLSCVGSVVGGCSCGEGGGALCNCLGVGAQLRG